MVSPFTLSTTFAYRHRPAAYLVSLAAVTVAWGGAGAVMFSQGVNPDTLRGAACLLAGDLALFALGALFMVFAIPSRSPWD